MKDLVRLSQTAQEFQKDIRGSDLGKFLFKDNEEFREKTNTCYIVKDSFTMQNFLNMKKKSYYDKKP